MKDLIKGICYDNDRSQDLSNISNSYAKYIHSNFQNSGNSPNLKKSKIFENKEKLSSRILKKHIDRNKIDRSILGGKRTPSRIASRSPNNEKTLQKNIRRMLEEKSKKENSPNFVRKRSEKLIQNMHSYTKGLNTSRSRSRSNKEILYRSKFL